MSGKNEAAVIALACQIVKLRDRARIWKQTALTLENEAMSARADAVARAEADRVRIEGLAKELRLERETCTETADLLNRESEKVRGLSVQAQDQRSEIERLRDEAAKYKTERDDLYQREGIEKKRRMDVEDERDALRAEVAALQERLRASITRGDFAQMEVAALKSQNPKQHPVKVGEWVRRLVPSPACDVGTVAKVVHVDDDTSEIEYDVKRIDGQHGVWFAKNCEPCDPPGSTHAEPDLTQLHTKGKKAWSDVPNATQWVEEMRGNSEATHDTEAGKAAAEAVIRDSQMTEIKVGDVVEVVSASGGQTWMADVGSTGKVRRFELIDSIECVRLQNLPGKRNALGGYVSLCDVRKVTT